MPTARTLFCCRTINWVLTTRLYKLVQRLVIQRILRPTTFCNQNSSMHKCLLSASTEVVHTAHRSDSSLYFDTGNMYQIRIKNQNQNSSSWRLLPATMLERLPHVCRVKITFTLLPTSCFVSRATRTNSMKCLVIWIPLRIRVRSIYPTLPYGGPHKIRWNL